MISEACLNLYKYLLYLHAVPHKGEQIKTDQSLDKNKCKFCALEAFQIVFYTNSVIFYSFQFFLF